MSFLWLTENIIKKAALPEITIHPEWVPDVGETIQLAFDDNSVKTINTKVDEVICGKEDGKEVHLMMAKVMSRSCWVKLSKEGLSRFDEAQMNHGNSGLPDEFYVLRFKKKLSDSNPAICAT